MASAPEGSLEEFVRGRAWPAGGGASYPRADPADCSRLPIDTWGAAQLPVGVRLELVGDARSVRIGYRTETDDLGYRGAGAGTTFSSWRGSEQLDEQPASLGDGTVVVLTGAGPGTERTVVYLPEGMRPTVLSVAGVGGTIEPAPSQPRWLAYGDSIAEGWVASGPAHAWPAVAGRTFGLDVVNLGYAGSARGEIASAEQVAALEADVISVSHGTNCWTRIPHSADMMTAVTAAFLDILRQGHPHTPIVVTSPVLRPDAEDTANRLGATLGDLRAAMEEVARARIAAGDRQLTLVEGGGLLEPSALPDGIHPGDEGHAVLARVFGGAVAQALAG